MNNILVPIDFSGNTYCSIVAACDLALTLDCDIILFHSYFEMIVMQTMNAGATMDAFPVVDPCMMNALQENSEIEMQRAAEKIYSIAPQIAVRQIISPKNFSDKINEICKEEAVLMIVMSATGSGKKDSFSGSATSALFDRAPVPIVAIPENYVYNRPTGFKNILYATNFSDVAQDEIRFILDYFITKSNRLICCHLHFHDEDPTLSATLMKTLKQAFVTETLNRNISFEIIETADVEEALENFTENNNIGLISFHEHNRSAFYRFFHRSTIKKNIFRFNIPLLVFRKFEIVNEES